MDLITKTRTSYFKTTDADALKQLLESVITDGDPVTLITRNGNDGPVQAMFYCSAEIMGIMTDKAKRELEHDPDWADEHPDDAYSVSLFLDRLSALIAPDDACLIKIIGYEGMRSLSAFGYIVTTKGWEYASLQKLLTDKARSVLGDPKWIGLTDC